MGASGTPNIVAAVMTYNRRDQLRKCLEGIRAQRLRPSAVLVVDNASTDGTPEMLAREFPDVQVFRTQENLGCAGAMHEALRETMAMKPDYIWLFDDDVESLPEALETLYREMKSVEGDRRVGVLRAMIKDPQTGEMSGGGISIGGLIRPEMVADVGLPRSELFIELSDHHYSVMMRRRGWEILRVPVVLATHPVDKVKSLREIMAEGYRAKPWRLYYAVRNRIYFALYMQHAPLRTVRHLGLAARLIALLTIFGRPRRGQLLVLRGVVDGFRGRLGRRVEPGY